MLAVAEARVTAEVHAACADDGGDCAESERDADSCEYACPHTPFSAGGMPNLRVSVPRSSDADPPQQWHAPTDGGNVGGESNSTLTGFDRIAGRRVIVTVIALMVVVTGISIWAQRSIGHGDRQCARARARAAGDRGHERTPSPPRRPLPRGGAPSPARPRGWPRSSRRRACAPRSGRSPPSAGRSRCPRARTRRAVQRRGGRAPRDRARPPQPERARRHRGHAREDRLAAGPRLVPDARGVPRPRCSSWPRCSSCCASPGAARAPAPTPSSPISRRSRRPTR